MSRVSLTIPQQAYRGVTEIEQLQLVTAVSLRLAGNCKLPLYTETKRSPTQVNTTDDQNPKLETENPNPESQNCDCHNKHTQKHTHTHTHTLSVLSHTPRHLAPRAQTGGTPAHLESIVPAHACRAMIAKKGRGNDTRPCAMRCVRGTYQSTWQSASRVPLLSTTKTKRTRLERGQGRGRVQEGQRRGGERVLAWDSAGKPLGS